MEWEIRERSASKIAKICASPYAYRMFLRVKRSKMRKINLSLVLTLTFAMFAMGYLVAAQRNLTAVAAQSVAISPSPSFTPFYATSTLPPNNDAETVIAPNENSTSPAPATGDPEDPDGDGSIYAPMDAGIGILAATATRTPTPINVGNFVWDDLDQDGQQDGGEPGLANVTVQLWNSAKSLLLAQTTTNGSGIYALIAPLPGDYRVRVLLPNDNDAYSPKNLAGGDDTDDSDINPYGSSSGFTDIYTFASNLISITTIDAGIIKFRTATPTRTPTPVNIGNFVWDDLDQDGRQDDGEPGLANVTVQLWNSTKNQLLDQTTTNGSGIYTLQSSGPGDFRIRVVLPSASDSFSPKNLAGGDDTKDSDINPSGGDSGFTDIFTIASNVISTTIYDAGIIKFRTATPTRTPTPVNIGNFVWDDLNGDGDQDPGEPGIPDVTVQAWNSTKTLLIDQTTTNASGIYTVTVPTPGDYRVRVILPSVGDTFTGKNLAGGDDTKDSDINPSGGDSGFTDIFTIASNVISTTIYDAGIITVDPVTVGNLVWYDANGDGLQTSSEAGIAGRTVQLWNSARTTLIASTVTDASGIYSLTAPNIGDYRVRVVLYSGESYSPANQIDDNPFSIDDAFDSDIIDNIFSASYGFTAILSLTANTTWVDAGLDVARASIVGTMALEGHPAAPSTLLSVPLSVRVQRSGVITNYVATSNDSGVFIVPGVSIGTVDILVKHSHTLAELRTGVIGSGNNSFNFGTLRQGDANNDNFINVTDFSILATAFNTLEGQPNYNANADFNDDGIINITDFSLLATNFGQSGDSF